jgi:DNA replication ATP-dependent helicase Dna2
VILYSLMMMERYGNTLDTGLLLYLKTGHMLGVPAYKHEKRALVMKRNELVRYLSHAGAKLVHSMPGR